MGVPRRDGQNFVKEWGHFRIPVSALYTLMKPSGLMAGGHCHSLRKLGLLVGFRLWAFRRPNFSKPQTPQP